MSLNHNSRIVAEARALNIHGRKCIGSYQLRFSIEFVIPPWLDAKAEDFASLSEMRAEISISVDRKSFEFLGHANPEVPQTFENSHYPIRLNLLFDLNLSAQQLFAIEEFREGNGLAFKINLTGKTKGKSGTCVAQDVIDYNATLSDWSKILEQLGYADILVVGIQLPRIADSSQLRPAIEWIRQAHGCLLNGQYSDVVGKCRMALDSLQTILDDRSDTNLAVEKFYNKQKRMMSKTERELLISEVVRHYTHPAHHVEGNGQSEWYSRSDATFILALAAATISSGVGRVTENSKLM